MLTKLRTRLTYANVMATIAVFVALGGSSYAAIKVTGRSVVNSSLTGADVKNESLDNRDVKNLRSNDFAAGQAPKDGPAGPTGPQGTIGLQGERGLAGSDAQFNGAAAGGALTGTFPNPTIALNSVGGVEVVNNSLTGDDVNEGTLGQVPSAANAAALGGVSASDYQRRCAGGPYRNIYEVFATSTFSTTYTSVGVSRGARNCFNTVSGYVRRAGQGVYYIRRDGTETFLVGNVRDADLGAFLSWDIVADATIGNQGVFRVIVRDAAGDERDFAFSVATFN